MVQQLVQELQEQSEEIRRLRGRLNTILAGTVLIVNNAPAFVNLPAPIAGGMLVGDSTPAWVQLTLGVAGSVLWSDGSTEPAWVVDVPLNGYLNLGQATAPVNVNPGDLTMSGRLAQSPNEQAEITAAATVVDPVASVMLLTSDANYSLSATPTVNPGDDGQELLIVNVGANTLTFQDDGTLPGSNLRLTAAIIALAPGDSLTLRYLAGISFWIETAHANLI